MKSSTEMERTINSVSACTEMSYLISFPSLSPSSVDGLAEVVRYHIEMGYLLHSELVLVCDLSLGL